MHNPRVVGANAGATNEATLVLRGRQPLTDYERSRAKWLRRHNYSFRRIALDLNISETRIRQALANVRTPRDDPPRASLNVSIAARDYFLARQQPGEAMWRTVNRVLGL